MTTETSQLAERADELEERLAGLKAREQEQLAAHLAAITAGDREAEDAARKELASTRTELAALAEADEEIRTQLRALAEAEARENAARRVRQLGNVRGGVAGEYARRKSKLRDRLTKLREEVGWVLAQPERIRQLDAERKLLVAVFHLPGVDEPDDVEELDLDGFLDSARRFDVVKPSAGRPDHLAQRALPGARRDAPREAAYNRLVELASPETAELLEGRFDQMTRRED